VRFRVRPGAVEDDIIISLIWTFLAMWKTRVSHAGEVNPGLDVAGHVKRRRKETPRSFSAKSKYRKVRFRL